MREIALRTLDAAMRQGADSAEAFVAGSRSRSLYVDGSSIKSLEEKEDMGVAVRVASGRRLGEASSSIGTLQDADRCASRAREVARLSPPDPRFKGFVQPGEEVGRAPEVWDESLVTADDDEIGSIATGIVDTCERRRGVRVPTGLLRVAAVKTLVANTLGVEVQHRNTMLYLHFTAMTDEAHPGEGVERVISPHLRSVEPAAIGRSLGEKVLASASAAHLKEKIDEVVFLPPDQLSEMLAAVAFTISAENVNRRRSAWAGKIGEPVASRSLTIVDDPHDPRSVLASLHDDEGASTSPKTVVKEGVLSRFLYDSYNAGIDGLLESGNGLRRDPTDPQAVYQKPLSTVPFNLVIEPGSKGREELLSSYDRAVLVERMAYPQVNPLTGGFGLEVRCAHIMEGGETVGTVDHALLVGNLFRSLKQVAGIASDPRPQRRCVVPTVGFGGLQLIGSG